MNQFEKMRIAMRYWLHGKGYTNALRAMNFAASYHTGLRKDKVTPEFHHQISITSYLRTLPSLIEQEVVLAAGFLHDVVEDYDVSIQVIKNEFGEAVAFAVDLLTKDKYTNKEGYYEAMRTCPNASILKGADRMHNFQTMNDVFDMKKKKDYIDECRDYILPMLKSARYNFPQQEPAYENIKLVLMSQIELINFTIKIG